jgi:signal transduction histidine kinase
VIQLDVIAGSNKGASFRVEEPSFIIGRGRTNRVILTDRKVSAKHAQIECRDADYVIRDLGSTNGTFVNGQAVTETTLDEDDELRLGHTIVRVTDLTVGAVTRPAGNVSISDAALFGDAPVHARVKRDTRPPVLEPPADDSSAPNLIEAYRNLLAMYKVSSVIRSNAEVEKILDEILGQIFRNFRAERGVIMLIDDETGELVPTVYRSRQDADESMTVSRTIVKQVVERQEAILTSDATVDERFSPAESIVQQHIRSAMCAPLTAKSRPLGIIYVDCRTEAGTFKKADLELLTVLANEAGMAVENRALRDANIKAERLAAVGQTVAGLSHYIKNVLSCMEAGSEIIRRGFREDDPDAVRKGWGIVSRNERKISELVLDMLNYSTPRTPAKTASDLNNLIQDVVESIAPRAEAAGARVALELDRHLPTVPVDSTGLHRVILNLLTNALDAVADADDRTVTVSTVREDDHAVIEVADNGPGIPEDVQPKIFDVFMSTKGDAGTGLGLAVVKKIVNEHAGEVRVTSAPDGGAAFRVLLPFEPAGSPAAEA